MRLYRFVCEEELQKLRRNGVIIADKPSNRFNRLDAGVNTAESDRNGIFFSIQKGKGVHHFMMDTVKNHYLLILDMDDKDKRIVEFCDAVYDDLEAPIEETRYVMLPEVTVCSYAKSDLVSVVDMNDMTFENHGAGYITFSTKEC